MLKLVPLMMVMAVSAADSVDIPDKHYRDGDFPLRNTQEWQKLFATDVANVPLANSPLPAPEGGLEFAVTYRGKMAGFGVGRVKITTHVTDDRYAITYDLEQKGVGSWFSDAEAESYGIGTFDENGHIVGHYYSNHDYESEDEQKFVEIFRAPNDRRVRFWRDPNYEFRESVTEDMAIGTLDPMAAFLQLGFPPVAEGQDPCDRRVRILEGRLLYDLIFTPRGQERLRPRGKNRYGGPAYKCRVTFKQVAGYRPKDKKREDIGRVHVYLAAVPNEVRTDRFAYIPVRITGRKDGIGASLDAEKPTFTLPNGEKIRWTRG